MKLEMKNGWSAGAYALFRCAFGLYLGVYFAQLLPWGAELLSSAGMIPDASASPLARLLPNVFVFFGSPLAVNLALAVGVALSALFALGLADRAAGIGLWYLLACAHARNPLMGNPALPYLGWMLLAHAFVPKAPRLGAAFESGCSAHAAEKWEFPPAIFAALWILMALGYTYSGLTKLTSVAWIDGSAFTRLLENPLARPTALREWLLALDEPIRRLLSYGTLGFEILFAPLALIRKLRPWLWAGMLGMHLTLIVLVDFADLSLGMVMLHAMAFDPAWIAAAVPARARSAARSGTRGANPSRPIALAR